MTGLRLGATIVGLVLATTACGARGATAPRLPDDGPPGYEIVDGWVGYRRLPPPDVSGVTFTDHATTPPAEFRTVAGEDGLLLVFFGYLSCPDVCPTTLADLGTALGNLPPERAERIDLAMVTVDPERDSGPAVAAYLDVFVDRSHALLASDDTELRANAEAFGVMYEIEEHEPGDTTYAVGHTASVFVVDDRGRIMWEFGFGADPAEVAPTLSEILDELYG